MYMNQSLHTGIDINLGSFLCYAQLIHLPSLFTFVEFPVTVTLIVIVQNVGMIVNSLFKFLCCVVV